MEHLLLIIPLVTIGLFWVTSDRKFINVVNMIGTLLLFASSIFVTGQVLEYKVVSSKLFNGFLYIDSLSCLILVITTFISFLVSIYSIGYMNEEFRRKHVSLGKLKLYYTLLHGFILTMIFTITTQNMG